jgi:hypothetical protein
VHVERLDSGSAPGAQQQQHDAAARDDHLELKVCCVDEQRLLFCVCMCVVCACDHLCTSSRRCLFCSLWRARSHTHTTQTPQHHRRSCLCGRRAKT